LGQVLFFHEKYHDTLQIHAKQRYALKLESNMLPVLIKVLPDQKYKDMDLDLYGYTQQSSTSYFYPNDQERNHHDSVQENIIINSAKSYYYNDVWYFFDVYASPDSSHTINYYTISVIKHYHSHYYLKKLLLLFVLILSIIFGVSVIVAILITCRHRILFWLRLRTSPNPNQNGATIRMIKRLGQMKFKDSNINHDDATCVICYEEYEDCDIIRILKCKHHFHKICGDTWLKINRVCPLCQQDIEQAKDNFQISNCSIHIESNSSQLSLELMEMNSVDDNDNDNHLLSNLNQIKPIDQILLSSEDCIL
jgi:hypothetical protein